MKKIKVEYLNEESQILMTEEIYHFEIPRKYEVIIWHKMQLRVDLIEHHFEDKKIIVLTTQI